MGALLGGAMGTLSTAISEAIGELKSGNVRSHKEAALDIVISGASGAVAGAVGAKFPGMEGLADMVSGAFGRGLESLRNPKMSWKDRLAYALNPKSMAIDFATGFD